MVERTVKIKGYTVSQGDDVPDRLARRGEVVEISREEAERGDELGYFYTEDELNPEVEVEADETTEAPVSEEWVSEASDDELDLWIAGDEDGTPTVEDVLDAAGDNAESAERLLASEVRVAAQQERDVRKTLDSRLSEIAGAND